jgi:SNF2 family DNA or RNA helicase
LYGGYGSSSPTVSLASLKSNDIKTNNYGDIVGKGLTIHTREVLADWGYLDKTNTFAVDGTNIIAVTDEDAKRLWDILETIYYEGTSEMKIGGKRLYNFYIRSIVQEKYLTKIHHKWNSEYNNYAKPDYTNIPILSRHSYYFNNNTQTPFSLRGAQKEGIKYLTANNDGGLLAHEVGFGKTTSAITKCSEMLLNGKAKRIFISVPNVVYDNWIKEISGGKDSEGNPIIGLLGNSDKKSSFKEDEDFKSAFNWVNKNHDPISTQE